MDNLRGNPMTEKDEIGEIEVGGSNPPGSSSIAAGAACPRPDGPSGDEKEAVVKGPPKDSSCAH